VPREEEWENMLKYNSINRIGPWNANIGRNANASIKFDDNLMLPAAGMRFKDGATYDVAMGKESVKTMAIYWSLYGATDFYIRKISYATNIDIVGGIVNTDALPVRCIKK